MLSEPCHRPTRNEQLLSLAMIRVTVQYEGVRPAGEATYRTYTRGIQVLAAVFCLSSTLELGRT